MKYRKIEDDDVRLESGAVRIPAVSARDIRNISLPSK